MEHGCPQDVAGVVGLDLDLVVNAHDLRGGAAKMRDSVGSRGTVSNSGQ